jgi:hypothetical protein
MDAEGLDTLTPGKQSPGGHTAGLGDDTMNTNDVKHTPIEEAEADFQEAVCLGGIWVEEYGWMTAEQADEVWDPVLNYVHSLETVNQQQADELRSLRAEVGMLRNQRDGATPPSDRQREQRPLYGQED